MKYLVYKCILKYFEKVKSENELLICPTLDSTRLNPIFTKYNMCIEKHMIKKIQIYGERSSGTNYLVDVLLLNFDVEIVSSYGWKHYFGFHTFENSDDVLFIGIVRNLEDWINSLYREKHYLPLELTKNIDTYLTNTFYSIDENNNEVMNDRNIETKERHTNIFELRHIKNKFLIETMPRFVKHYCLLTHDNLVHNFVDSMNKLKQYNLPIRTNIIEFPLNIYHRVYWYKPDTQIMYTRRKNEIPTETILQKANLFYETILFPEKKNFYHTILFYETVLLSISVLSEKVSRYKHDEHSATLSLMKIFQQFEGTPG